jgi:hypothetical protein
MQVMLNVMMSNFLSLMTIVVMATQASQHPYEDMQLVACRIESKCFSSIFILSCQKCSGVRCYNGCTYSNFT